MTDFSDRSQHPTLNAHLDFRRDLAKLLQKYNVEIVSEHKEDLHFLVYGELVESYPLNEKGANFAGAENINGLEPKKKRERKRKPKNLLRRWIYEWIRYNPQLDARLGTGEVYAKTQKEAERTAIRHCKDYTAYGSHRFKRLIQVSEPIALRIDVGERERFYDYLSKSYNEYEEVFGDHTEGWDKLTDLEAE